MRKVTLRQYRLYRGKWQLFQALKVTGKPDPHYVIIDGQPVKTSLPGGGQFYLDYQDDNGKRVRRPCGLTPREAKDAWALQSGVSNGQIEAPEPEDLSMQSVTIEDAISKFLAQTKAKLSEATYSAYKDDAEWFKDKLNKHYVKRVDRDDVIRVLGIGRDENLAQATINRRVLVGLMALRNAGSTLKLKKGDWPKTPQHEVEVYTSEEMKSFFEACSDGEKVLFQTYLCSGFRNREVSTLTKDSVFPKASKLAVKSRPEYSFNPKNYEAREVRIPASLMSDLERHMKKSDGKLVFPPKPHPKRPNYGGNKPDTHHLDLCKAIAHRAKLNCGHCVFEDKNGKKKSCKTGPHCEKWYLHKWRHTFATNMLRSGVDIKTLQKLLGHKNLSTTDKYLKALGVEDIGEMVEASTLAALVA